MKIKGFEDYSIFEDGRVIRTYKNGKTKELKCCIHPKGYKQITLCKNSKNKTFLLHRLLALHFIENPNNKPTVDHENRDPLDNSLSNLRWYTMKEQCDNRGGKFQYSITKGGIYKSKKGFFRYQWYEDKVVKRKYFKTLELAQIFEIKHLETYHLQS
tara:strand:+ start:297 stop:767 length:471 start_codon:yes stop_codon:yes gene_type:complete